MTDDGGIPKTQRIISILWPSFLTAGAATVIFFTALDPAEFLANRGLAEMDRMSVYTIGFFLFWLLTATSSALTHYFERPADTVNRGTGGTSHRA